MKCEVLKRDELIYPEHIVTEDSAAIYCIEFCGKLFFIAISKKSINSLVLHSLFENSIATVTTD